MVIYVRKIKKKNNQRGKCSWSVVDFCCERRYGMNHTYLNVFFFFWKKNLFLFSSIYLFVFFSQILINLHLTTSIFVFFQWRQLLVECSLHQRKAGPGSWTCTSPGVQVFSKIKYIIQNKDCTFMWPFRPYSQLLAQLALSHPLSSANWGKNISYIYL